MARACAIFGVDTIYVYAEGRDKETEADVDFLVTMLRYMETPQFLRKHLFPKVNSLKFAGVMLPLRIPSHTTITDPKLLKKGDVREGMIVYGKGGRFADIGIGRLLPYHGRAQPGKRVTMIVRETAPALTVSEISRDEVKQYWGYAVKRRASLQSLLSQWDGDILITSRRGRSITDKGILRIGNSKNLLAVFGSPSRDVHDIMGGSMKGRIKDAPTINFFPDQQTATVRLEEAVMGVLSIIHASAYVAGRA